MMTMSTPCCMVLAGAYACVAVWLRVKVRAYMAIWMSTCRRITAVTCEYCSNADSWV